MQQDLWLVRKDPSHSFKTMKEGRRQQTNKESLEQILQASISGCGDEKNAHRLVFVCHCAWSTLCLDHPFGASGTSGGSGVPKQETVL